MKRDYEIVLNDMLSWKDEGKNYVMEVLLKYNVKYMITIERGIESTILSLMDQREQEKNPDMKKMYDDRIAHIADAIYQLESLDFYKDCVFWVRKKHSFEEVKKYSLLSRKPVTRKYIDAIKEIIKHNQCFEERFKSSKKSNKKKYIPRSAIRSGNFTTIKIC